MKWRDGKPEDYTEHLQQRELAGEHIGGLLLEAKVAETQARYDYLAAVHCRWDNHEDLFRRWTLIRLFIEAAEEEIENE